MNTGIKRPIGDALRLYSKYSAEANVLYELDGSNDRAISDFANAYKLDIAAVKDLAFQFELATKEFDRDMSAITDEFRKQIDAGGNWSKCVHPRHSDLRSEREWRTRYQFRRASPKGDPVQFGQSYDTTNGLKIVSWFWIQGYSANELSEYLKTLGVSIREYKLTGWGEKDGLVMASIEIGDNVGDSANTVEDAAEKLVAPFRSIGSKVWKTILTESKVISD